MENANSLFSIHKAQNEQLKIIQRKRVGDWKRETQYIKGIYIYTHTYIYIYIYIYIVSEFCLTSHKQYFSYIMARKKLY